MEFKLLNMKKEFKAKKPINKIVYKSRCEPCLTWYVNKKVSKKLLWLIPYKTYPPGVWQYDFSGGENYKGSVEDYNNEYSTKVILDYSNGEPKLTTCASLELYFEGEEYPIIIYENENGYPTLTDYLEDLRLYHPEVEQLIEYRTLDCGVNI